MNNLQGQQKDREKEIASLASLQYSGQFLKRDATPTASNAYGIQQRSKKSECNLNPK